jgi:small subunit ribosomal protein S14
MAKKALLIKAQKEPKFKVRKYNRCPLSGRASGYIRYFGISRIQFREMAHKGLLPGVRKASW